MFSSRGSAAPPATASAPARCSSARHRASAAGASATPRRGRGHDSRRSSATAAEPAAPLPPPATVDRFAGATARADAEAPAAPAPAAAASGCDGQRDAHRQLPVRGTGRQPGRFPPRPRRTNSSSRPERRCRSARRNISSNQTVRVEGSANQPFEFAVPGLGKPGRPKPAGDVRRRDRGTKARQSAARVKEIAAGSYKVDLVCGSEIVKSPVRDGPRRTDVDGANPMNKRLLVSLRRDRLPRRLRAHAARAQQANNEEFARRQYESGVSFMQNHRYAEALEGSSGGRRFVRARPRWRTTRCCRSRSTSSTSRATSRATQTADRPAAEGLPGYRLRADGARALRPAGADPRGARRRTWTRRWPASSACRASFPAATPSPAAGFYAGETLRIVRRTDEALERYRRVTMEYPRSPWAARAALSARLLPGAAGQTPQRALQEIQWVRQQFPNTPVAAEALESQHDHLSPLRAPAGAARRTASAARPSATSGPTTRTSWASSSDRDGRVLLGHKAGVAIFDDKGAAAGTVAGRRARRPSSSTRRTASSSRATAR